MKTTALLLLCFVFTANFCKGQNLVPNPSFEEFYSCPNDVGQIDSVIGWTTFGNGEAGGIATPDYFNNCTDSASVSNVSVPNNIAGHQYAATGNAYAGIICYTTTYPNFREILGCKLLNPLQIGESYRVAFKVNCAYGGAMGNYLASNGLGVKLSVSPHSNIEPFSIDNSPLLYSDSIISDTSEWILVAGEITADSAYEYMGLGNFFDAAHTDTLHTGNIVFRSYYYIDDVALYKVTPVGTKNTSQYSIEVFPNPATETINIKGKNISDVCLINIQGIPIAEAKTMQAADGILIDVKDVVSGSYFLSFAYEGNLYRKVIVIKN